MATMVLEIDREQLMEFDFEPHIKIRGNLVGANGEQIPNARLPGGGISSAAKKDFRRGTVVCRHWLRGLCMKGETCEFLHQVSLVV